MISEEEVEKEKKYLDEVYMVINNHINILNKSITQSESNIDEISKFIADHFYEMDSQEVAVQRNLLEKLQLDLIALKKQKFVFKRQKKSAYFGRIDFKADDEFKKSKYYVGIAHLIKENVKLPLILDWRAPLSSLYYDYEIGRGSYIAPMGEIAGDISLKRQYKVDENKLVYAFDSSLTIGDEILRQVLGGNTDSKMKNIVATIQSEQNKIIRNNEHKNLLVQGIAGSGKTSIALHRVAYLLYNNHISSNDILILSPSYLFSDYISNVLPELGEQNTPKITFEELAKKELESYININTRSEMIEDILSGNVERAKEVEYKGGFEFYENLKTFMNKVVDLTFHPRKIVVGKTIISKEIIAKLYGEKYKSKTPAVRLEWIADYVVDQLNISKQNEKAVFERVKKVLFNMFDDCDIINIYDEFLTAINLSFSKIGYEDLPALLYIKNYLIGIDSEKHFKHLIIDEMQDYSPIVFDLLNIMFSCEKTILGDIYQSFEKRLTHEYLDKLKKLIGNCKLIKIGKTYRSTKQIASYCQNIINLQGAKNFNREGKDVVEIKKDNNLMANIEKSLKELEKKYDKIAIITETIQESELIFKMLYDKFNLGLVGESVGTVSGKINVIPVVFTKGLEFDAVIYLIGNKDIELSYLKKNCKYIACTRALHELVVCK